MSILATTHPTMLDVAKRLDPNGKIATLVEMLSQDNEILDDAVWVEGNLPTGHLTSIRTGLPDVTWRSIYGFVQPSKSTSVQVTDSTGMLEAYAEVDKALVDINGNAPAFRLSEERAFIESMSQELAETLIYGNEGSEPAAFTGLAPRYNSLSAANGQNIISAGGSSNLESIWLVNWSPDKIHCIYPKGSQVGLQSHDKGQVTIDNLGNGVASSGRMEAYRTHYRQDAGLCVRDWRYAVRIANIDVTAINKYGANFAFNSSGVPAANGPDIIDLMTQALELIQGTSGGRPAFYMSRKLRSFLRRQVTNKTINSTLSVDAVAGKQVLSFDGIPVRRVDKMTTGESQVS
jgi:hypothetical protein